MRVGLRCRIGHVIRANHEGNIRRRKFRINVFKFEHFIIGHVGFSQQHVHMARHTTGNRVDCVFHFHAFGLQLVSHFTQRVLCLCHCHTVTRHDDDLGCVLHDEGGIISRTLLDRTLFHFAAARSCDVTAEATKNNRDERAVHAFTHDVGQDRTG